MSNSPLTEQQRFAEIVQSPANTPEQMLNVVRLYDQFVRDFPQSTVGYHNRSDMLKQLGFYDLALRDAERALQLSPNFAMGWCNKAFILNILGRYQEGWAAYEWRWKTDVGTFKDNGWPIPRWQGESLENARLLIYAEQGFGDNIQFVRYAIEAKRRGLNVIVVNHPSVENLLNYNLARYGVESSPNGAAIADLDYYVSMMSLPHYFGTTLETIPCPTAYLQAEPNYIAKFQQKLPPCKPKIGVVWAGSNQHDRNASRSLSFEQFSRLFAIEAEFHCLQIDVSESDRKGADSFKNLHFWDHEINDFSDTAGLISQMDLVISVDTSVAHLAAAMGKPTWIFITHHPDFRWLLQRSDSPWYENVQLFRQESSLNWETTLNRVVQQLSTLIEEKR